MTWAAIIALAGVSLFTLRGMVVANRRARRADIRAEAAENKIDALAEWVITTFDMTPEDFPIEIDLVDADVGPLTEN